MCFGRTTVKWRRSSVAMTSTPSLSASATTEASTVPREIVITGYELCDPHPIAWQTGAVVKSRRKIAKEAHFCFLPEAGFDEIRDFGDDELRDE
jgi:hypothetical protein